MNFIKRWLIKRSISKSTTAKHKNNDIYDDVLAEEIKRLADVNRTADKILKAKLIRQQSEQTLAKIRELDDEFEEEEGDDDPQMDMETTITNALINKFLNSGAPAAQTPEALEKKALEAGATPAQIQEFKQKMGVA